MTHHIEWAQLENGERLQEDTIKLRVTDYDDEELAQFRLRGDGQVNWWKGIEIKSNGGGLVGWCQCIPPEVGVSEPDFDDVSGGTIVLWKAKAFGAHTPMYDLNMEDRFRGKKLAFRWLAD